MEIIFIQTVLYASECNWIRIDRRSITANEYSKRWWEKMKRYDEETEASKRNWNC